MVTLEQVEQLDRKVKKVVSLIEALRIENNRLNTELSRLNQERRLLEVQVAETRENNHNLSDAQELLEKGILGAIDQLSSVEENGITGPLVEMPNDEMDDDLHLSTETKPHEDDQKPLDIF